MDVKVNLTENMKMTDVNNNNIMFDNEACGGSQALLLTNIL